MMCWSESIPAVPSSNVDVTVVLPAKVMSHVFRPVHGPDHPANVVPASGVAVNSTAVPLAKVAVQVCGQLIPAGELVTVPLPVPTSFTVSTKEEPVTTVTFAVAVAVLPPAPVAVAV